MYKSWILILTCFLLVGCRVHDVIDCDLPPVSVPQEFYNDREGTSYDSEWWKEFQSDDLNEVMTTALENNLDLQKAWNRLSQAYAQARIAGSERFPQVDLSNQYEHSDLRQFDHSLDSFFPKSSFSENRYKLTPTLRYEVDLWRRISSLYQSAEREACATYEDVQAAALLLSGAVTDVWLTIQEQQVLIEVIEHQIEASRMLLDLVEHRFAVGQSSALDVYQQRLQLANTEATLPPVLARLETASNQLATLMAETPKGAIFDNAAEVLKNLPPFPDLGSPMNLLQRRPDLRAEFQRLLSADYAVASAIADRFPKLTLNVFDQYTTTTIKEIFQKEYFSVISELLAPVIDGGRRRAEVERRKAIVCERLNSFGQAFLNALQEVESAVAVEKYQRALLEKVEEEIALAELNLREARIRNANGLDDYLTVIAAVQSLQGLERERVIVRKELLANRALLYRSLGGYCL